MSQSGPETRPRIDAKHTADLIVLTIRNEQLKVLLVTRKNEPYRGRLALPGGFLRPQEDLEATARRELLEETGLDGSSMPILQLHTYSAPDRDPRYRVITTAFLVIAPNLPEPIGSTDVYRADWVEFDGSLQDDLAFDHWEILNAAIEKIRGELEYRPLAPTFLPAKFTIGELRQVYELVWGTPIDAANFRRKVTQIISGFVVPIKEKRINPGGGRPAELYVRGEAKSLYPPILRPPVRHRVRHHSD